MIEAAVEVQSESSETLEPTVVVRADADLGAALVDELLATGFSVWSDVGGLRVRPVTQLPPEAREIIQAHRGAILAALEQRIRQIRTVVAEIACVRGWSEEDVAEALQVASRCPDLVGWMELRDLVQASASLSQPQTNPSEEFLR